MRTIAALLALTTALSAQAQLREGEFKIEFPHELIGFRSKGKVVTPSSFPTLDDLEKRLSEPKTSAVLFFKLYEDEHNHYGPKFSPDGRELAFLRADINRRTSKIRRLRFGTGEKPETLQKAFADSYDYMFEWGPRYEWLAKDPLMAFASQAETSGNMNLYLACGDHQLRVTSGRQITKHPSFHPTEPLLLYEAQGRIRLLTFEPKAGSLRVKKDVQLAVGSQPSWSPDGKSIAYCREVGRVADRPVYEISARSYPFGRERRLFRGPATAIVRNPTWSPDGKHVAFYRGSKEAFGWELMVAPLAGGAAKQVASKVIIENHFDDIDPSWSPTSDRLYYFTREDQQDGYYRIHWVTPAGERGVVDYSDEFTTASNLRAPRTTSALPSLAFVATERLSQGIYLVVLNHW